MADMDKEMAAVAKVGAVVVEGKKKRKKNNKKRKHAAASEGEVDQPEESKEGVEADNEEPEAKKSRNFSDDLKAYLELWEGRESGSGWKFNKVLQAWALTNMLDEERVDSKLFKALIPYILTIKGGALTRLQESLLKIINGNSATAAAPSSAESIDTNEQASNTTDTPVSQAAVKRAVKLQKKLEDI